MSADFGTSSRRSSRSPFRWLTDTTIADCYFYLLFHHQKSYSAKVDGNNQKYWFKHLPRPHRPLRAPKHPFLLENDPSHLIVDIDTSGRVPVSWCSVSQLVTMLFSGGRLSPPSTLHHLQMQNGCQGAPNFLTGLVEVQF